MNVEELADNSSMKSFIDKLVGDPHFQTLKDAFVSHTPGGENGKKKDALIAHGKLLGTRYVFNELEKIARKTKPADNKKQPRGPQGKDPDLED